MRGTDVVCWNGFVVFRGEMNREGGVVCDRVITSRPTDGVSKFHFSHWVQQLVLREEDDDDDDCAARR